MTDETVIFQPLPDTTIFPLPPQPPIERLPSALVRVLTLASNNESTLAPFHRDRVLEWTKALWSAVGRQAADIMAARGDQELWRGIGVHFGVWSSLDEVYPMSVTDLSLNFQHLPSRCENFVLATAVRTH